MNEIAEHLRRILESDDQVDLDETAAEPFDWVPNRLYAYLLPNTSQEQFESGPTAIQRFNARVVFVVDDEGEGADRQRRADVSAVIDAKRDAYLAILRDRMSSPPYWDFAQAAEAAPPATLETRAVSLQLTGYRIVS